MRELLPQVRPLRYWRGRAAARIDFALFWERVGTVALFQRIQVAYQIGSDEEFAERCFRATSNTARLKAVCEVLCTVDIIIKFAEDA